jgi:hypothetical protein
MLGFNPDRLIPVASLNRVRIVDLPGVPMDADAKDKLAFDLLGAHALALMLHDRAGALGLPVADIDSRRLPVLFDECFDSPRPQVRAAAEDVARRFGQHLGYLVATLKRGDKVNRLARTEWDDGHWTHWGAIQRVWLGGGLVSGQLGQHMLRYAQAVLAAALAGAGAGECALQLATNPSNLALIGAARSMPANHPAGLVFDFGQSRVKRACATFANNALTQLQLLPAIPAPWEPEETGENIAPGELGEFMSMVLATSYQAMRQRGMALGPTLNVAIASYLADGQPADYISGIYGRLRQLAARAADWLAQDVSRQVGAPLRVNLMHDGTAAARTFAGEQLTAVIMFGTALGVGFAPSTAGVRSMAPRFSVMGK